MKTVIAFFIASIMIFSVDPAEAQLKNLGNRIKKKVNERVNRRFDQGVDKGLDEVEKGVGKTVDGEGKSTDGNQPNGNPENNGGAAPTATGGAPPAATAANGSGGSGDFMVNTKFDYVPGELLMVYDDFEQDAVGDFPARWNTDGTGEVVTFGDSNEKWFMMKSGSDYVPDLPNELPEEYTIEFDLAARGLDQKTTSSTLLEVILDDNNVFDNGRNRASVRIPFCQYHHIGFYVRNAVDGKAIIKNNVEGDIRKQVLNQPHISIAVNKTRFRLWVNETKYVDVPRMVPPGGKIKYLKFRPYYFKDGKEDIFIRNLKIAEGGLDLRSQLLKDGMVSTNGILFDVNSANIQPESYGVLRQIALAMEESPMSLNIIGHTDSDGPDEANLDLSKQRAESVKSALVNDFGIDGSRLTIEGKGETQPVAENNSTEGKAANRRVEFVSL
jgi:outer membrane protein OmpA-like peptidoglycan-associated protein